MIYFLGALTGKFLSLVGIGSAICGLFVKRKKILATLILILSFLDTAILCSIKTVCNFQVSFLLSLIAGAISGTLFYYIRNKFRKNK